MKVGIVGLGRMGNAIAQRLVQADHEVQGFDIDQLSCQKAKSIGVTITFDTAMLAQNNSIIWLMVPAGPTVDKTIETLLPHMKEGDIIVDGGNSNFANSMKRAKMLETKKIFFLDCGTSGGLLGREIGFSLMVGGDQAAYEKIQPLFTAIAAKNGVAHVGPCGAGHYVKMVHNGIEYGILQAYAEGFHLLRGGTFKESNLDLEKITRVWSNGSVIRSWLLDLAHDIFEKDQKLDNISGEIGATGMGAWSIEDAKKNNVPVPVMQASLDARAWSQKTGGNYATKVVSLFRNAFGGHSVKKK